MDVDNTFMITWSFGRDEYIVRENDTEWLGSHTIKISDDQKQERPVQIGLRDDGVVVWRIARPTTPVIPVTEERKLEI